ncbi:Peptidase S8/S53 domain-containing protein [Cinnamomum micranthum f. kanehirae]|uniref:Peptidase S8/S53 domain-containing protein n=1 Tax=Cinnamomum micranthum f. kanehirae TaxID=337451 RepID=A0A443PA89_9MAGN|nr:Peptidase S8/S53 domain-containing protein [Cinnamomum micranthum f. kanehirae]
MPNPSPIFVYMGERKHSDPSLVVDSHHTILATVLGGSKQEAADSIFYSYKHGFSGFAARLTNSQAEMMAEMPDVVDVIPNDLVKLHTTRSWDYLGLSSRHAASNLLTESNMGDGTIIGVIDSGIWPESKSFNDKGMGPIPTRWKGACVGGDQFNSTNCNRKLIGARWFVKGLLEIIKEPINTTAGMEYISPRDAGGHGTHTSSTAAGSLVHNVSYKGLALGTARGGAPRARLAMYKVCWETDLGDCSSADILKAFDEAIHDGVDVLSVSLGLGVPYILDVIAVGSLHAVLKGITVVCSAGNRGPTSQTVGNVAPWIISVAASTMDRSFPSPITLGNNQTIMGQAMFTDHKEIGFKGLPDVAAPGVNVLAAMIPKNEDAYDGFAFDSGTSMACPHVAGIVALVKSLHPSWSPAAIRSALTTTASTTDTSGEPIFTIGDAQKLAGPFDFGGGIVNPNRASDPGLIYDMGVTDYVHYLCSFGYNNSAISKLTLHPFVCPSKKPSILNLNLPSVTVPNLRSSVTITRTVTNVGPIDSTYVISVEHPLGVKVAVRPQMLVFNSTIKKLSFTITLSSSHKTIGGYYIGSLSWNDGIHKVQIIYMRQRPLGEDATVLIEKSHHSMLASVLGSKEAAADALLYSYKHGISGFAAKLTESQAEMVAGIWPESKSFNDDGMGPIPSHWKGVCEAGDFFNSTNCNRKLIGARWYIKGLLAELKKPINISETDYLSARDAIGHGTHTSATAAGSFVANISYKGLGLGVARGGAPGARLAMYKVCWNAVEGYCSAADVIKAFDDAIHDGVDVLSLSIVSKVPLFFEVDRQEGIAMGSFHAVARGITVVCAAGNDGPLSQTVSNIAPWIITVAAVTMDRAFPTVITLGNNRTIMGQAMFTGNKEIGFAGLYNEWWHSLCSLCQSLSVDTAMMRGKIVLCFGYATNLSGVKEAGGVGVIVAKDPVESMPSCDDDMPCVQVDYEIGTQILYYIRSSRSPLAKLSPSMTLEGKPLSTKVAEFSSRGPSSVAPAVLKPDIAAPGVNVLAAILDGAYAFDSGTSMACPHISAIAALLKAMHPSWSPAAIKSALVTTASTTDESDGPIFTDGAPRKVADPFDYGGGIVNPNRAADPGLIYDMDMTDYIHYLCSMGYDDHAIAGLTRQPTVCPSKQPSILDVNLPAITVPNLKYTVTVTRTATNVGPVDSIYTASIEHPTGVQVTVKPNVLIFNSTAKKLSFTINFSSNHKVMGGYYFGSLSWSDGKRVVRSPISVRAEFIPSYANNE